VPTSASGISVRHLVLSSVASRKSRVMRLICSSAVRLSGLCLVIVAVLGTPSASQITKMPPVLLFDLYTNRRPLFSVHVSSQTNPILSSPHSLNHNVTIKHPLPLHLQERFQSLPDFPCSPHYLQYGERLHGVRDARSGSGAAGDRENGKDVEKWVLLRRD